LFVSLGYTNANNALLIALALLSKPLMPMKPPTLLITEAAVDMAAVAMADEAMAEDMAAEDGEEDMADGATEEVTEEVSHGGSLAESRFDTDRVALI
jgi:hypothetical protein